MYAVIVSQLLFNVIQLPLSSAIVPRSSGNHSLLENIPGLWLGCDAPRHEKTNSHEATSVLTVQALVMCCVYTVYASWLESAINIDKCIHFHCIYVLLGDLNIDSFALNWSICTYSIVSAYYNNLQNGAHTTHEASAQHRWL